MPNFNRIMEAQNIYYYMYISMEKGIFVFAGKLKETSAPSTEPFRMLYVPIN